MTFRGNKGYVFFVILYDENSLYNSLNFSFSFQSGYFPTSINGVLHMLEEIRWHSFTCSSVHKFVVRIPFLPSSIEILFQFSWRIEWQVLHGNFPTFVVLFYEIPFIEMSIFLLKFMEITLIIWIMWDTFFLSSLDRHDSILARFLDSFNRSLI